MYGLPVTREYPMNDRDDVKYVVENFNNCPLHKRYILATNIKKAFIEFGIKKPIVVNENNTITNFLKNEYIVVENVKTDNQITEIYVDEFKQEVMNKIQDFFGSTTGNQIVKESIDEYLSFEEKMDTFFINNDVNIIMKKLDNLKSKYNIITKLDDIDLFKLRKSMLNDDSVYFPKTKNEMGKFVFINDNMFLLSKNAKRVNEYLLLPMDSLDYELSKKIITEECLSNISIGELVKRMG